jgi:DNA polymerase-1
MDKGLLVIDGSHVGFAASATKKLFAGEQETQGIYGFLRTLRPLISAFPILSPIVLWDGQSWRKAEYAFYKASRDAEPETKYQEDLQSIKRSFRTQKPYISRALRMLGVHQMIALNYEADDLAGMLVRRYQPIGRKMLLISGDQDWLQLVGPGVGWFDPVRNEKVTVATLQEKTGVKDCRAWLEVKALMGDPSDEISGVGGIGEKGAVELVNTFGSVANFLNRSVDGTLPKLPKKFQALADDAEKQNIFRRNMKMMDLHSQEVPPPIRPTLTKGALDIPAFEDLCKQLAFKSILNDMTNWIEPFQRIAA